MTEEQIILSKRAVACQGWRWMPGMLAHFEHDGRRVRVGMPDAWASTTALPDLSDPATLGCLVALVREAWGDSEMHMTLGAKGWVWLTGESRVYDVVMPINAGASEAEALVAALEGAP